MNTHWNVNLFVNSTLAESLLLCIDKIHTHISRLNNTEVPKKYEGYLAVNDAGPSRDLTHSICQDLSFEIQRIRDQIAAKDRNLTNEAIEDFTYLMAAFADEHLIIELRKSNETGSSGAVEQLLFGTASAGEEIFNKIRKITSRRSARDSGLAAAYILLLAFGFRGQYVGPEYDNEIMNYYRELAQMAFSNKPEDDHQLSAVRQYRAEAFTGAQYKVKHIVLVSSLTFAAWISAIIYMEIEWYKISSPLYYAISKNEPIKYPNYTGGRMEGK